MAPETVRLIAALLASIGIALVTTPVARAIARRVGLVAAPREDRWHRRPTALLGGPAIVTAALGSFFLLASHPSRLLLGWAGGAILIAALGVLDDLVGLRPVTKLIGQIVAALVPISLGLTIPIFHPLLSFWITLFWIVGIANAFNLLDNMDGLAAGIAAISAGFLCFHAIQKANGSLALAAVCVSGAALGFLVYNFNPASIFMGDGGSLFLGYSLGTLSLLDLGSRPLVSLSVIAVPLFVLAMPIFDTALVTVLRVANRRSIAQGGRDHSSHRLVSLGLSERRAVVTMYALAAATGLVSLVVPRVRASFVVLIALVATLAVYYFGSYLGSVNVYRSDPVSLEQARRRGLFILDTFVAHKQRILDVSVDLVIVAISYLSAYLLRYEGSIDANLTLILRSLPFLIAIRLVSFFVVGLYRSIPGAFSLHDFFDVVKAVSLSSAVFVTGLVLLTRFELYSRAVMVMDAVLTLLGITAARIALRSVREILRSFARNGGSRVLIVGAGNLGQAAARLMNTDDTGRYQIVGFLDDNPDKLNRRLYGLRVIGSLQTLESVIERESVHTVVLASSKIDEQKTAGIREVCRRRSVDLRELQLFESVSSSR